MAALAAGKECGGAPADGGGEGEGGSAGRHIEWGKVKSWRDSSGTLQVLFPDFARIRDVYSPSQEMASGPCGSCICRTNSSLRRKRFCFIVHFRHYLIWAAVVVLILALVLGLT
uniref:Uncharacterized protein n=1 Tax=Arundo donax TaxID=35708 RepID=A0A0A9BS57_ARUDO